MLNKTSLPKFLTLLAILLGIALAITYRDQLDTTRLTLWISHAGIAGPLVFMAIYAIGTVFFVPGLLLTLAGGALFGPYLGTFYNLTAATIGATLAFLLSRYLASGWVEAKTGGRFSAIKQGVEKEGWRFVAFVRLVPIFPFNLLNYALGITRIRLSHYVLASYICMLPGTFAYTYLGYVGREAIDGGESVIQKVLLAIALLALAAFLPRLIRRIRGENTPSRTADHP